MEGYYTKSGLTGDRLRRVYEIAPDRVKQYLEAEIDFVLDRVRADDVVLELGCGYGRVALRLAGVAARVVGIDTAPDSLALAESLAGDAPCEFFEMDATALGFADDLFDLVACVQNGICAFGVDPEQLMREALRVTRPGGRVMFSTYSPVFWRHRLAWFEAQAAVGLMGPIDYTQSRDGVLVCRDGFRSGTFAIEDFVALCGRFGVDPVLTTVDRSSVFCEIMLPTSAGASRGPYSLKAVPEV